MHSPPTHVKQFARAYIRTIEELDVFFVCVTEHDRWWDAAAVARRTLISESAARRALDHLVRSNLFDIRVSDAVRYRFHPGTEELATQAAAFATEYHRYPVDIVKFVARSGVSDSVRDFADAFRIKRDDNR